MKPNVHRIIYEFRLAKSFQCEEDEEIWQENKKIHSLLCVFVCSDVCVFKLGESESTKRALSIITAANIFVALFVAFNIIGTCVRAFVYPVSIDCVSDEFEIHLEIVRLGHCACSRTHISRRATCTKERKKHVHWRSNPSHGLGPHLSMMLWSDVTFSLRFDSPERIHSPQESLLEMYWMAEGWERKRRVREGERGGGGDGEKLRKTMTKRKVKSYSYVSGDLARAAKMPHQMPICPVMRAM